MIVQKSGGGFLYATTDLAAVKYRSETLKADRVMYFIDARQALHMKQVYAVSRLAGFAHEGMRLEHLAFGTIMGKDGKPFKTRSGGTVKLADLLQEAVQRAHDLLAQRESDMDKDQQWEIARKVGIGAVKYADLSKTRTNDYIFDWDSMLSFEGNTAPYLQYAYTRIRSILRKADSEGDAGALQLVDDAERKLALQLLAFKPAVEQLAEDSYPHNLCSYIYDTAAAFMSFYEACPILKDDVSDDARQSRLALANATARVLREGLDLLGIEVMEQM
jgi:arginyl-tRNA synthetase